MASLSIPFNMDNQIQYLRITVLEGRIFALHLESSNASIQQGVQTAGPPDLLMQRTRTGKWIALEQGIWQLDAGDLKRLGRYIEEALPFQV